MTHRCSQIFDKKYLRASSDSLKLPKMLHAQVCREHTLMSAARRPPSSRRQPEKSLSSGSRRRLSAALLPRRNLPLLTAGRARLLWGEAEYLRSDYGLRFVAVQSGQREEYHVRDLWISGGPGSLLPPLIAW